MEKFIAWFQAGGPTMWPLLVCSILGLAIVIEKTWNLRRGTVIRPATIESVRALVEEGKLERALVFCREHPGPLTNVIREALEHYGYGWEEMEDAVEYAGRQEGSHLERYLNVLGVVAAVSPMLGLLGTVTGLIEIFRELGTIGAARAAALSGGIAEALITTVTGLIIGIPALACYHVFHGRVERLILEMERHTFDLFRVLRAREVQAASPERGPVPGEAK